jgi:diguanylate cyclase (GGDEF)-like protein
MATQIKQCPIPPNEADRLRALRAYDILDSQPEIDFDTLTRLAANALNMPAAVIGLMDADRLWFKSELGLGVPQLDRQIAFCAYAVLSPQELLIVDDLRLDARFKDNPLVTQAPYLRFYAGAALIDPQGYALGTIAVVDTSPRTLSETQGLMLKDLSKLVITALESRYRAILLENLAMTDHLTGLANRARFERTLNSEIAHFRVTGKSFTVFYMDLDNFKIINDTYGHSAGDEVLVEVAHLISKQVRTEDLPARLGGDEFGIFMREDNKGLTESLAKRIVDTVTKPITLNTGHQVSIGISIGIATYSDDTQTVDTLMSLADQALYIDKRN